MAAFVDTTFVDGYVGGPHITETQTGLANQGLYGPDDYVLDSGRKSEAQVLTNNSIRIFDAVYVIQGRRDVIAANAYTDVNIDNGAQGVNRNDIIVRRYMKDESSEEEDVEYVVVKGTPTAGEAVDPEVTEGDIRNGATLHDMKLYRVRIEGLNIVEVVPLFKVLYNMSDIQELLAELNSKSIVEAGKFGNNHYVKWSDGTLEQWGIVSLSYTNGYGTITYPVPFVGNKTVDYFLFAQSAYVGPSHPVEILSAQKNSLSNGYVYSRNPDGGKAETHSVDWMARGRWK